MAITKVAYTPTDGLKNATSFPDNPGSNANARKQFQDVFDQVKSDVNVIVDELEAGALNTIYYTETETDGLVSGLQGQITTNDGKLTTHKSSGDHDGRYYTETETDGLVSGLQLQVTTNDGKLTTHKSSGDHDGRYYTETETDGLVSGLQLQVTTNDGKLTTHKTSSDHDGRYYTETEVDAIVSSLATAASVTTVANNLTTHKTSSDHDGRYYTEAEVDAITAGIVVGGLAPNSITNTYLASDVKVGSLAVLTTTDKTSVTAAINEHDTEIGAMSTATTTSKIVVGAINELNSLIYQSQNETRSATQTTQQGVASVPTGTFNGQCEGSIGGQSLVNSVVNPDFAGGTTGWTANNSSNSITSKILSNTGNGTSTAPSTSQDSNIIYQSGKKVKAGCSRVRVTNSVCSQIRVRLYGLTSAVFLQSYSILTPIQNQWYDLSDILSLASGTAGEKIRIYIYHLYPDAATASGKVMEIDGNSGVHAIDLGTSASDPNYNKTNAELNNMIGGVLQNGINNVSGLSVVSTGKNLFDGFLEYNGFSTTTGAETTESPPTDYVRNKNKFITIKPLTSYTFSHNSSYSQLRIFQYDAQRNFIGVGLTATITTDARAKYLNFRYYKLGGASLNAQIQLEEGSTATTYEPYISSTLTPNKVLRSVPNGIKDRIYWSNGECYFEQNVVPYTLASGDIIYLLTTLTNYERVAITRANLTGIISQTSGLTSLNAKLTITNFLPNQNLTGVDIDTTAQVGTYVDTSSYSAQLYLMVAKGTYADLAAARTALAGTIINYQLATPITTKLDLSFRCYENGSFACSGSVLNPVIAVTTPTTIAGSVNDNIRGLTQTMRILSEQFQFLNEKNQTFDANNIVTDYRLTNQAGVLLYKAVLSGGTTPSYTTLTETYYDNAGNLQYTVTSTLTWVSAYKLDSKVVSSIV